MEKIRSLNHYQKGVLVFMLAMVLIFAVVYPSTIARVGYRYNDAILVPTQENGDTLYSGKIQGQQACFIVSDQNTVVFHHGDIIYGPYTVKEDAAAIPKDREMASYMTGVEIRQGDKLLFRGGELESGDSWWLFNEDGSLDNFGFSYVTSDGMQRDENGNVIDPMEPSATTVLE